MNRVLKFWTNIVIIGSTITIQYQKMVDQEKDRVVLKSASQWQNLLDPILKNYSKEILLLPPVCCPMIKGETQNYPNNVI